MALLPQAFNPADVEERSGGSLVLIPDGQYKAVIVGSEMKATSNGSGQYIALKIVITEGQYRDTEFTERLNVMNPNDTAVKIAYQTLAEIARACGFVGQLADTVSIHNKPMMIEVKAVKSKEWTDKEGVKREGKEQSEIKKYLPIPSVGFAGKPAFTEAAPAQAASKSLPWK